MDRESSYAGGLIFAIKYRPAQVSSLLRSINPGVVDINEPDGDGNTALHTLARDLSRRTDSSLPNHWRKYLIKDFLKKGADLTRVNRNGDTALMCALCRGNFTLALNFI